VILEGIRELEMIVATPGVNSPPFTATSPTRSLILSRVYTSDVKILIKVITEMPNRENNCLPSM
jgi:hypothetical protein